MASTDKRRNLRAWKNKRDAAKHRATARFKAGEVVKCGLCHKPIDMTLHYSDRWAWTYDHVEAIANGGHILGVAQDAHRSCNSAKGDGTKMNPLQGQTREW